MSLIKSKKRVADHGEVFTPDWLVEKMLDLVKGEDQVEDRGVMIAVDGEGVWFIEEKTS